MAPRGHEIRQEALDASGRHGAAQYSLQGPRHRLAYNGRVDPRAPLSKDEANARLLANVAAARAWDAIDAARWRDASDAERAREVTSLLRAAESIARASGIRPEREPLAYPRFDRLKLRK